jgi:hypothetical protein
VSTKILRPHTIRKIPYDTPRRGRVEITVEASAPVDIYVVQSNDIFDYRSAYAFRYRDRIEFYRKLELPFEPGDAWYLVIRNRSDDLIAIHYEVYY